MIQTIIQITATVVFLLMLWQKHRPRSYYIVELRKENDEKTSFLICCYPCWTEKDVIKINKRFPNHKGFSFKKYDITNL